MNLRANVPHPNSKQASSTNVFRLRGRPLGNMRPRLKRFWLFFSQIISSITRHQTLTMASALAFGTLTAVVPLLLIGIAVANVLGTEDGSSYAELFILAVQERLPDTSELGPLLEILRGVTARSGEIAGIGLILLFITAYTLLASVEYAFNRIWQVTAHRTLLKRAVAYLATIVVVPMLMALSVYFSARVETVARRVANTIEKDGLSSLLTLTALTGNSPTDAPKKTGAAPLSAPEAQTAVTPSAPVAAAVAAQKTITANGKEPPRKDQQTATENATGETSAAGAKIAAIPSNAPAAPTPSVAAPVVANTPAASPVTAATQLATTAPITVLHQSWTLKFLLGGLSLVFTCFALTLLLHFMPCTPVRWRASFYGGLFSGVLIELTKYTFSYYAQSATTSLTRLYGTTMLAFPLALLWLWLIWVFVLLGAEVAFNLQNYRDLAASAEIEKRGLQHRLYLAVRTVLISCELFHTGESPAGLIDRTAERLNVPGFAIRAITQQLAEKGVLRLVSDLQDGYLPARDIGTLTLHMVIDAVSGDTFTCPEGLQDPAHRQLKELFAETSGRLRAQFGHLTMRHLLEREGVLTATTNDADDDDNADPL